MTVVYQGMEFEEQGEGLKLKKGVDEKTVSIPDSVEGRPVVSIGAKAFKDFRNLEKIHLPGTLKEIGYDCFTGCQNLSVIDFSEGLEVIGDYAFVNCKALQNLVFPDSLREMGIWAFAYCTGLRFISVGPDLKHVGKECFTVTFYREDGRQFYVGDIGGHIFEYDEELRGMKAAAERCAGEAKLPVLGNADSYDAKNPLFSKFKPVMKTGITFDDIAGLEKVKEAVRDQIILPFKRADLYERFGLKSGGGILLYGPPGTGKTMLAQAIATEVEGAFFSVKGSDLISKYVGESEQNVKKLFAAARSLPVSVIFFDEFEVIGRARGNDLQPWADKMLSELLAQMQGFEKTQNSLLVLAATNMPWVLDSALMRPGRFNRKVYVSLPDEPAREQIVRNGLKGLPVADDIDYAEIVRITEGFNAADVTEFADRMKLSAVKRSMASGNDEFICMKDAEYAAKDVTSSVDPRDLAKLDAFSKN